MFTSSVAKTWCNTLSFNALIGRAVRHRNRAGSTWGSLMIRKVACLIICAVSVSGIALANDIYKWTDENGSVHYGDRPSGDASEERMLISSKSTNPNKVQARVQSRHENYATAQEEKTEAAKAARIAEEDQLAQAKVNAQKCETYKARLQKFVTSRRLYKQDENGERVYLDEEQTQAARERVENRVQEYCNS